MQRPHGRPLARIPAGPAYMRLIDLEHESSCHARAAPELRMLRQRSAAGRRRRAHLFVRVHILRGVCGASAGRRALSELWRRVGQAAGAALRQAREVAGLDTARVESACRMR